MWTLPRHCAPRLPAGAADRQTGAQSEENPNLLPLAAKSTSLNKSTAGAGAARADGRLRVPARAARQLSTCRGTSRPGPGPGPKTETYDSRAPMAEKADPRLAAAVRP